MSLFLFFSLSLSPSLFLSLYLSLSLSLSAKYMSHFERRDLRAFSVEPLLLYPTHYTGEPGYLSDTETSTIWDDEAVPTDWDRQYSGKKAQKAHMQPSVSGDTPPPSAHASTRDEL